MSKQEISIQEQEALSFLVKVEYNYEGNSVTQYGADRNRVSLKEAVYLYVGYSVRFYDPETGKELRLHGKEFNKAHRELILDLVHNTHWDTILTWKPEHVFKTAKQTYPTFKKLY